VNPNPDGYIYVYILRCADGSYYVGITRDRWKTEADSTMPAALAAIRHLGGPSFSSGNRTSSV